MKLSEWVDECKYVAEQTEPFARGWGPSEFEDKAQFVRYATMQRDAATREGFHDSAQYIQHCLDDLSAKECDEPEEEASSMHCDQCEMLSINGVPCHEHECPNANARWDADAEEWKPQRKCFDCGCTVDEDDPCCSAEPTDDIEE